MSEDIELELLSGSRAPVKTVSKEELRTLGQACNSFRGVPSEYNYERLVNAVEAVTDNEVSDAEVERFADLVALTAKRRESARIQTETGEKPAEEDAAETPEEVEG